MVACFFMEDSSWRQINIYSSTADPNQNNIAEDGSSVQGGYSEGESAVLCFMQQFKSFFKYILNGFFIFTQIGLKVFMLCRNLDNVDLH